MELRAFDEASDLLSDCEAVFELDEPLGRSELVLLPDPVSEPGTLNLPLRKDALPEHSRYADTGCDLAPACLECPFAQCKYDDPPFRERLRRTEEHRRQFIELRNRGLYIDAIAKVMGLTRRSVFRISAEVYGPGYKPKPVAPTTVVVKDRSVSPIGDTKALRADVEDARRALRVLEALRS